MTTVAKPPAETTSQKLTWQLVHAEPGALVYSIPGVNPATHPLVRRAASRTHGGWSPEGTPAASGERVKHSALHYAEYIGRVGVLAAALGVGAAVAGTPGIAWAEPTETDSTSSSSSTTAPAETRSATDDTESESRTAAQTPDSETTTPSEDAETDDSDTAALGGEETSDESAEVEDPEVEDAAVEAVQPAAVEAITEPSATPEALTTPPLPAPTNEGAATEVSAAEVPVETAAPAGNEPRSDSAPSTATRDTAEPATAVATTPVMQIPAPLEEQVTTADLDTLTAPTTEAAASAAESEAVPTVAEPETPASVDTVNRVLDTVLAPLTAPTTPAAQAAQTPVLWGVLAWMRRTFFNSHPTLSYDPTTTSQVDDTITGRVTAVDADADPVKLTASAPVNGGTVVVNPDGTFTYTASTALAETGGTDTFTVTASDAAGYPHIHGLGGLINLLSFGLIGTPGHTASTTVTLNITAVNAAPIPGSPAYTLGTPEHSLGAIAGALHVTDPDLDDLTYTVTGGPADGAVNLNADTGAFTYTPTSVARHAASAENATPDQLTDNFSVTVDDSRGGVISVPVTVTIDPTNTPPTMTLVASDPDSAGTVHLTITVTDPDGDPVTYLVLHDPSYGTIAPTPGGYDYTPTAEARHAAAATPGIDTDTFQIQASDAHHGVDTETATVAISPANVAPSGGTIVVNPGFGPNGEVTGTITDVTDLDHDTLSYDSPVASLKGGTATVGADGSFSYVPTAEARHAAAADSATELDRLDTFTVTITDGHSGSTTVFIDVDISPDNIAPGGVTADPGTTDPSTGVVTGYVTATDADNDTLSYAGSTTTAKGSVVVTTDGAFTYTPTPEARHAASDDNASAAEKLDEFTISVSDGHGGTTTVLVGVDISPTNVAPVGVAASPGLPDPATGVVTGTITASDADNDPLTFNGSTTTSKGAVTVNADGTFTYTPTDDARHDAAADGATADDLADSFTVTVSDGHGGTVSMTVGVAVSPANTAPATSHTVNTPNPETGGVTGAVSATDADNDPLTYTGSTTTAKGSVVVNADGTFTYTPTDDARHAASDENASATDKLDTFVVTVNDSHGGLTTVPITVTIDPDNAIPATSHTVDTPDPATGQVTGAVTATDPDADPLTYTGSTTTPKGTAVVNADGSFTYTPIDEARHAAAVDGATVDDLADTFTVTVDDAHGGLATVPITVAIAPANSAPTDGTAVVDPGFGANGEVTGTITATDDDNDALTYIGTITTPKGSVVVNADGTFTYTPTDEARHAASVDNASATDTLDTFTVTVSDGHGGTTTVPVDVDISPANIAPGGVPTFGQPGTNGLVSGSMNVTDTDGDTVTYTVTSDPGHGAVVINPDGTFTYTPQDNARLNAANTPGVDTDSFTVTADDGHGGTVDITVAAVQVAPADAAVTATAPVGKYPVGIGISPDGTRAYVANANSSTVTVIDTTTNTVVTTVAVGAHPEGVAVSPDGTRAYITNGYGNSVSVINTATNTVAATIPGFSAPAGVAFSPDGTRAYVTNLTGNAVSVIDTDPASATYNTVLGNPIAVGAHPAAIRFSPNGTRAYVSNSGTNTVSVVDTDPASAAYNTVVATVTVGSAPYAVAVTPDGTRAYVASPGSGTVSVIDTASNTVGQTITGITAGYGVAISPDGTVAYIAKSVGNQVSIIDTDPTSPTYNTVIATVTYSGYGMNVAVGPDGTAYVTSGVPGSYFVDGWVSVIDLVPAAPSAGTTVGTPDPASGHVTVTLTTSDAEGDELTVTNTAPSKGSVVAVDNGDGTWSYTYTPTDDARHEAAVIGAPAANKQDSFTINVVDALGGTAVLPVLVAISPLNLAPVGGTSTTGTPDPITGKVTGTITGVTDPDSDSLTYTGTSTSKGSVTVSPDGTFTYTPTAAARHAASADDATATGADRDSFYVQVSDGHGGSVNVAVTVAISPTNAQPAAAVGTLATDPETGVVTGSVTGSDPDGDALVYSGSTTTAKGTAMVNPDGTFSYTPTPQARHDAASDGAGTDVTQDSFTVTVTDGHGGATAVPVTVAVSPTNATPVLGHSITDPDPDTGLVSGAITGTDPDGDTLTYSTSGTSDKGGTVTVNQDGSFTYTPSDDARHGAAVDDASSEDKSDTFTIGVNDSHGFTSSVSVFVAVDPDNTAPAGAAIPGAPDPATGVVIGTVAGTDPEGDPLTYSGSATTTKGAVVVTEDGTFTYTPTDEARHAAAADGAGIELTQDSFTVTVDDAHGGHTPVPVTVTIGAANQDPTVGSSVTDPDPATGAVTGSVTADDPDGDAVTYTLTSGPTMGNVTLSPEGTFNYTPTDEARHAAAADGAGPELTQDSFAITVNDGHGYSSAVSVVVTISPVNDAPVINTVTSTPGTGNSWTVSVDATDPDGDPVSVTLTPIDTAHVSVEGTTVTVTDAAWALAHPGEQVSVTATADDGHGGTVSSTVPIGTVNNAAALGYDGDGQTDIPALPAGVTYIQVAAGGNHTLLLRADGQVVAVGSNSSGQTTIPVLPTGVTYTQVATGYDHSVLLRSDGQVVAVGENTYGRTNIPALPADTTYTQVAAGSLHTVLLRSDGTAVAVGDGGYGQTNIPALPADTTYTQVAAGSLHTVLLRSDGTAVAVGDGGYGQTNIPALPADTTYTQVAAGERTTALLRSDGQVVAVGYNSVGQSTIPALPTGMIYTQVATGGWHTALLRSDGHAAAVGDDSFGQTAIPPLPAGAAYTQVSGGDRHTVLLSAAVSGRPSTVDDAVATDEDTPVAIAPATLLANDSDPDGNPLRIISVFGADHGSAAMAPDGTITYAPNANYTGTDTFTYVVSDGGLADAATITVTVNPVNDAPAAVDDTVTTLEDTQVSGNVLANDTDVEGTTLTLASHTDPAHGTLSISDDGSFTYTPATDYNGTDTFTYTATDGTSTSNEATVTINVAPVNDAPIASVQMGPADPDTGDVTVVLTASDTDGDPITVNNTSPSQGKVSTVDNLDGTWTFTYDPTDAARLKAATTPATDGFTITVDDGQGGTTPVSVNGVPVSPAVLGLTDTITVGSDPRGVAVSPDGAYAYVASATGNSVSVIDTATNTTIKTISVGGNPTGVAVTPDGDHVYVTQWAGGTARNTVSVIDTATNTITATIVVGRNPNGVAVSPDGTRAYVTNYASDMGIPSVSVIDTATNTVTKTITLSGHPAGVAVSPNGTRVYVTSTGSNSVSVIDAADNSVIATIPVGANPGSVAVSPDGTRAYVTNNGPDTVSVIDTTTNTVIGTPIGVGTDPSGVALSPDGSLAYITNYASSSVSVIDTATNTVIATVAGGTNPSGVAVGTDGVHTYVTNVGGTTTKVLTLGSAANQAPVAGSDTYTTAEDTAVSGNVLGNDTDAGGATLSVASHSEPTHGTLVLNSDGSFTYTPVQNWSGADGFTYTATNGTRTSNNATVTITVTPVNDRPVANPDAFTTDAGTPVSGNVLTNDTDVDGPRLIVAGYSDPAHGTLDLNAATGAFTYTPNQDFTGSDSFAYTASDGSRASNAATVTITVNPANAAPVASTTVGTPDPASGAVTVTLTASDPDGDPLTVTNTPPSHGAATVVDNGNGTWTYTYDPTDAGQLHAGLTSGGLTDSFMITVADARGGSTAVSIADLPVLPAQAAKQLQDIGINNQAWAVAVSPVGDLAYVVSYSDSPWGGAPSPLSVINTTTNAVTTIPLTKGPAIAVAISPDGGRVYAPNLYSNTLSVINTATSAVTIIPVGTSPGGVALSPDGTVAYVTNIGSSDVTVINTTNDSIITTVDVGAYPYGVAITPNGRFAYVTNAGDNTVTVIDTANYSVAATVLDVANPFSVAVSPDGRYAYVPDTTGNTVSVIDTATNTVTNHISVGNQPYAVALSPDGSIAYITNMNDGVNGTVWMVDTATNTAIGDPILVGTINHGVAVSPDGTHVYVTNQFEDGTQLGTVSVISIASEQVNTAPAANPIVGPADLSTGLVNGSVNATDLDNDPLTYTLTGTPTQGKVTINPNGSFIYDPTDAARLGAAQTPGVVEADTFTVTVSDGRGGITPVPVSVPISPATLAMSNYISVGGTPTALALNPTGTIAYIADGGAVMVVNTSTNAVTPIGVGGNAADVAVTPDGSYVYVTNDVGYVTAIKTATGSTLNIPIAGNLGGVAITPNGQYAYVANSSSGTVSTINTATNTVGTKSVTVGGQPEQVSISPDGAYVYVTDTTRPVLTVIRTSDGAVSTISVASPTLGVAVAPNGKYVYATNPYTGSMSVIDTATNAVSTVYISGQPRGVAVSPDGSVVYVTDVMGLGSVSAINTATKAVITSTSAGTSPFEVAVSPDGSRAYVTASGGGGGMPVLSIVPTGP